MQIYAHRNLAHLLEIDELDFRHRIVVHWRTVAAGVCHIHIVAYNLHFLGLVAYGYFIGHGQRQSVDLIHGAFGCVGINQHRSDIAAYICVAAMETHIAAVRNVDLAQTYAAAGVENLYFMRAVYHYIKF